MAVKKTRRTTKLKDAKELQTVAMFITQVVRSSIEDYRVGRITRKQMEALEPAIRNSIYTALYAMNNLQGMPGARFFADWTIRHIPDDGALPILNDDFIKLADRVARDEEKLKAKLDSK